MKKIGVFVDVSNLYYCIGHRFKGKKLDYKKYREFIADLGDIIICRAYGSQLKSEAHKFIKSLKCSGYDPVFKTPKQMFGGKYKRKSDWDVGMTIDMITATRGRIDGSPGDDLTTFDKPDMMILGSADSDMEPLVKYLKALGIKVIVFAAGIASELYNTADECIEITESMLVG